MSASPLERITPALGALTRQDTALPRGDTLASALTLRPQLAVLTAFWIYVALSNVLYANSMQASLASMGRVFAPWEMAEETGTWVGRWTEPDGRVEIRGTYTAKWRRIDGAWLLEAEVFTPQACTGSKYCTTPPEQPRR